MSETRQQRLAISILVVVTLFWGISFPWVTSWQKHAVGCPGGVILASLTLIALRMVLALFLLAAWHWRGFTEATWREHAYGAVVGVVFGFGFLLQVMGMATTSPAMSAFFTSLACAWTPLLGWAVLGTRVRHVTLLGIGVALSGTALLAGGEWHLGIGEWLTIAASVLFAGQILLIDRLGRLVRADHLTVGFFGAVALLSFAGAIPLAAEAGVSDSLNWLGRMLSDQNLLLILLGLAILPTALSFHLMNIYQPQVPAHRAALIYLLEPVFAAIFSVCLGYEPLTGPLLLGGSLILAGNVLVELPGLLRGRPTVVPARDGCPLPEVSVGDDDPTTTSRIITPATVVCQPPGVSVRDDDNLTTCKMT
jgi:drug/metabolite transporter (DMT)-like permease